MPIDNRNSFLLSFYRAVKCLIAIFCDVKIVYIIYVCIYKYKIHTCSVYILEKYVTFIYKIYFYII